MLTSTDFLMQAKVHRYKKHVGKPGSDRRDNNVFVIDQELYLISPDKDFDDHIKFMNSKLILSLTFPMILLIVFIINNMLGGNDFLNTVTIVLTGLSVLSLPYIIFTVFMRYIASHRLKAQKIEGIDYNDYKLLKENYPEDIKKLHKAIIDSIIYNIPESNEFIKILLTKGHKANNDKKQAKREEWAQAIMNEEIFKEINKTKNANTIL